ncbi:MAG TPA: M56 family metallopeptidase [Allosphingosinicella sp.]|jgi:beta-lactamase regulating signal transducer with metallopeptidase domain
MSFEFLIEMAWKSALIAGVALALAATLRSRAAADRSAVLRVAVTLLLLLPLFSLVLPRLQIEAWAAEPAPAIAAASPADFGVVAAPAASTAPLAATPALEPTIWDDPSLLFLILYLGGVAMAAGRLGAGLWTLRRWTRASREVECPEWNEAFERACWAADAPRGLRLLVSDEAPSPLSWGLIRPVILIDRDTLGEPEDADAILAHEIAHVVRRDWAVLMLTRIAAALFWFNPLVWLLEREVVQQAEEAADIEAAFCVEPTRYAQTLVHWAQFNAGGLVPANSIAPSASALARRVRAILDARRRSAQAGSFWAVAAIAGCALFAVTLAVLQLIPAVAEARALPPAQPAPVAVPAPGAIPNAPAPPVAAAPPLVVIGAVAPAAPPASPAKLALHPHPAAPPAPPAWPAPAATPHPVPPIPQIDEAAIERHVQAAVAAATRLARVDTRRIAAEAAAAARRGVAAGAVGIERGAEGLRDGARRMEQEAAELGSQRYRERRIAEAAARGERLTHQELIDLSRDLRDGARGMREGAREMRRAAADMRREGND